MKKIFLFLFLFVSICLGQAELSLAINRVNMKDYDEADRTINRYLNKHPADHRAHFVKAVILTHRAKYHQALNSIERAINHEKGKAEYYQLAAKLYEELDKISLAIGAWKKCQKYSQDSKLFVEAKHHIAVGSNYIRVT